MLLSRANQNGTYHLTVGKRKNRTQMSGFASTGQQRLRTTSAGSYSRRSRWIAVRAVRSMRTATGTYKRISDFARGWLRTTASEVFATITGTRTSVMIPNNGNCLLRTAMDGSSPQRTEPRYARTAVFCHQSVSLGATPRKRIRVLHSGRLVSSR